ncbi:hypothetical protein [Streptomyces sp. AC495_CC817]|uniref:hypothetical protein n=1 Tax=Streptomyces sp. AC495_CC817 TaxID=2823900 RepID=UPI001C25326F|nr:hypothetical protein [Streptomyces sp. AC495_CC817]
MTFRAKYNGVCGNDCGDRVHEGDEVEYVDGVLVHVHCQPSDEDDPEPRPVCTTCWTTIALNGACLC